MHESNVKGCGHAAPKGCLEEMQEYPFDSKHGGDSYRLTAIQISINFICPRDILT